jgi:hypothetical protein|eukprot:SAG25_NODE_166_length_13075_cov_19.523736_13_plen_107_part_00
MLFESTGWRLNGEFRSVCIDTRPVHLVLDLVRVYRRGPSERSLAALPLALSGREVPWFHGFSDAEDAVAILWSENPDTKLAVVSGVRAAIDQDHATHSSYFQVATE